MKRTFKTIIFISSVMAGFHALSTELVYQPTNPSFGGNPYNGSHLLNVANAINQYEPDDELGLTAADRLQTTLQSRLLNNLLDDVSSGKSDGGQLETDDFILNVVDDGNGGLTLNIYDKVSGESSVIQVSDPLGN
ncbi:curli assembly protein CsgF [Vibrio algivorus]|uniref:Curli production assembly/transport component CsgF n=1 Tax=Vibrio algivorus TaxID=1667024 RepID=A0A557P565_9VIBR|nr:curli production assembly protein CsgF [Vibrio algivorus]GLT13927.1 curli production assembly protein CsgF [Vibrio algivorus]